MTHLTAAAPVARAGLDLTMTGWGAVTAVAIVVLTATALLFWVVCNTQRTTNLTRIIKALRSTDNRKARTRTDVEGRPSKTLTR